MDSEGKELASHGVGSNWSQPREYIQDVLSLASLLLFVDLIPTHLPFPILSPAWI
jgi:hypothetical protein